MIHYSNAPVCSFCVMAEDFEGVTIDDYGVCNCCKDAIARMPNEWWPGAEGERRMSLLVERLKAEGRGKRYDAVVGLSGGIDSAYLAHHMASQRGLRLLAVHVDAGWNSEPAVHNIEKLVRALDLDLITFVIEWEEMRDVQRAFLRSGVLNQDFPQDHAFFAILLKIAYKYDVRSFLSGVNFASENLHIPYDAPSGTDGKLVAYDAPSSTDGKHVRAIHRLFGELKLKNYPLMTMAEYLWITKIRGIPKRFRPLDYLDYDKEIARQELESTYGWRDYGPKHSESRFTKFYQEVYLPRKLGFDKRRLHLSSLIVSGQLTREAALAELSNPITSPRQAMLDTRFVAKKLEMDLSEVEALIDAPIVPHSAYASDRRLTDRLLRARTRFRSRMGSRH